MLLLLLLLANYYYVGLQVTFISDRIELHHAALSYHDITCIFKTLLQVSHFHTGQPETFKTLLETDFLTNSQSVSEQATANKIC